MSDDETFETAVSAGTLTYPSPAGNLKRGDFVCIKDHPCKIVEVSVSKTGKHGHAKASITALDVFTGRKYEEVSPSSHALPCPYVSRKEYQLLDIADDGHMSLMDEDAATRDDLNLPEDQDVAKPLAAAFADGRSLQVIVLSAMGKEAVISFRDEPSK